jgi:hypothetical protein
MTRLTLTPATKKAIQTATKNWHSGKETIAMLLDRQGDQISISGKIVKAGEKAIAVASNF